MRQYEPVEPDPSVIRKEVTLRHSPRAGGWVGGWHGSWAGARDGRRRTGFVALLAIAVGGARRESGDDWKLHLFLAAQGVLYAGAGATFMLFPDLAAPLLRMDPALSDAELAMLPIGAFGLLVVGYLYVQGARTHTPYFLASTCFHRVFVVLPGMATLYALGARPELCIGCGAVDATLVVLT